jgi:hypothetical protein
MSKFSDSIAQFDGQCAFALSTGKKGVDGNEKISVVEDGKTYHFSNPIAKLLWKILPGRREKAEKTWDG